MEATTQTKERMDKEKVADKEPELAAGQDGRL
jgi:hypothetical protein